MAEKTKKEIDEVIKDVNYISGVLNFLAAAFLNDDTRASLDENAWWVIADAESRIKNVSDYLNSH